MFRSTSTTEPRPATTAASTTTADTTGTSVAATVRRHDALVARRPRLGLLGAAALVTVASLTSCGSDDADSAPTSTVASGPAASTPADSTPAGDTTSPPTTPVGSAPVDTVPVDTAMPDHTGHPGHDTVPVDPSVSLPDAPSADPRVVDVMMSEYAFNASKTTVPAGPVTFDVTNSGSEPHHMMIGKLHEGETRESFLATYGTDGEIAAMGLIDSTGGITAIDPGMSGEVTSHLDEGDYIFVCYMPAPDGTRHLMKDMLTSFTVTAADDEVPADPVADSTIIAGDYVIVIPDGFTGQGIVELENQGQEAHEVSLMRMEDGKTFDDVLAWYGAPAGPPPFTNVGGVGVVQPGGSAWTNMSLTPGHYLAVCFVSMADGTPHVLVGMQAEFDIA